MPHRTYVARLSWKHLKKFMKKLKITIDE